MGFFLKYNIQLMSVIFFIISTIFFMYSRELHSDPLLSFIKSFSFLNSVIFYILAIEILKASLSDRVILKKVYYSSNKYTSNQTRLLSFFSAFPFGLGVSSFLKGLTKEKINTKPISQGMTLSMLVYPTTLASSYVFDTLNMSSILGVFLSGLPITLICLILSVKNDPHFFKSLPLKLIGIVITLGIINYIYLYAFSFFVESSLVLKQTIFYSIVAFVLSPRVIYRVPNIIIKNLSIVLFFISIGALGDNFLNWFNLLSVADMNLTLNFYMLSFIIIFVIPLVSMAFIHPLVLFLIAHPVFSPYFDAINVSTNTIYLIWVMMLINAQLISPVSLTTVLAISNNNNNIFSESFLKHYRYTIFLSVITFIFVSILFSMTN